MHLSPLVQAIAEPATLLMARRSRELKAQGRDIIDLSLGEPDHAPPPFALKAAHEALDGPWHKYPPVNGFADVREAIAAKGDEVVIPAPFWVTYAEQVRMAGGTPVIVRSTIDEDYKAPIERIAAAITPRTRLLIFSSPCNPSGSVLTAAEMEALADVVARHPELYVVSDEIYEHIVFDGTHRSFAALPGMMERTITVNGLSKAFALTGWRVGFLAAPLWIAQAVTKVQGQFTSGTNSIAQRVTKACMEADPALLAGMRADFLRRRDLIVKELARVPGWRCNRPQGAFYVLPDVSASLQGRITNSVDLSLHLLEHAGVSIVEGDSFGAPATVRLSYATSDALIVAAVDRIAKAIAELS